LKPIKDVFGFDKNSVTARRVIRFVHLPHYHAVAVVATTDGHDTVRQHYLRMVLCLRVLPKSINEPEKKKKKMIVVDLFFIVAVYKGCDSISVN
jgi:hypothetical protein